MDECPCYAGNQLACSIHGPVSEPPTGAAEPPQNASDFPAPRRGSEIGWYSPHEACPRCSADFTRLFEQVLAVQEERDSYHDALAALGEHDARAFVRVNARVRELEEQLERAEKFIAKQGMEYRFAEFCGGVANPASELEGRE